MPHLALACAALLALQQLGGHTFHRRTLENGLEALAVDDGQPGTVSVFMVYAVGNRAETAATTGLAHLCEHAMFAGTATTPAGKHDAAIAKLGGESNAYTRDDYTVYYDHKVPPEALEQVLALEADRMRGLSWDPAAFAHESERLAEEERHNNDPQVQLAARRQHEVWGGQGYGAGTLDEKGNTRGPGLELAQVRAFYDAWYHPRNAALVVVGGDPTRSLEAIARAFGALPPGPERPTLPRAAAGQLPRGVEREAALSRNREEWLWVGPARSEPDRLALLLLALLFERRTAPDGSPVEVSMSDRAGPDLFQIAATGPDASAAVRAAWGEASGGAWDEARLENAKRRLRDELLNMPLRARPYFSLAVVVATHAALGEWDVAFQLEQRLTALDRAALLRAAETWLAPAARIALRWKATAGQAGQAALPEDKAGLRGAAEAALASGDVERAIAAYEKLLSLGAGRIDTVIFRYELGALHRQQGRLEKAREELLEALKVVEYPAVRELLGEVERELKAKGGEAPAQPPGQPPAHPPPAHPQPPAPPPAAARRRVTVQGGQLPPAWASEAEQVLADLERWRGLPFLKEVLVEVLPEDPEGPAGWYEPDKKRLVVTRKGSERFGRGVMLHELFHALQDQHHDLSAVHARGKTPDQERAITALIEGEAMLAVQELMSYDFGKHSGLAAEGKLDEERFAKQFQYGAGLRFVAALRDARGWAGVSEAFARPPRSTAEVLHPERWLREREPLGPEAFPAAAAVPGQESLPERAEGEYGLRLFLARVPGNRPQVEAIGAALSGEVHRRARAAETQVRHTWQLAFASPEEAASFAAASRAALRELPDLVAGSEGVECAEERVTLTWISTRE